jgi:O-glycosyl hydrolase
MKSAAVPLSWPLATALLVLFGRSDGLPQNLAANPGFEAGNTAGWFAFGPPTISAQTGQVHSGAYAALVQNRTDTWNGIAQSLQGALVSGQTYNISAWVRLAATGSQTIELTMKKEDAGGTSYTTIASGSVSSNGWVQLSGQYSLNVSGTLTALEFYAQVPTSSSVSFYLDDLSVTGPGGGTVTGQCTVNWTNVFQRIDGFGASSAWRSGWNAAQADMFFSTNTGIGLSLLRNRIAPGGTTVETSIMQMAQARGARVWSAPWSPQTSFKSANANGVISVNGGAFVGNAANYQAYANQLAGYVASMKITYGINLYALSLQNEPNHNTTNYESCVWTGQQFREFIPYISAALAASNVATTKILLPESIGWATTSLHTPTMNDPAVAPLAHIIANHNYDGPNFETGATTPPAALNNYGKALWQTEVSTGDAYNGTITNALYWAGRIHQFMTVAQANAWHFWWLVPLNADNQGLTDQSVNPAKRMYALGNFSRFVRPNFYRIGVVSNSGPLQISAYKEPTNGALAIVVINSSTNSVTQTFNLSGFGVTSLTPWLTSASASLASQSPVAVSGPVFTNTIPGLSIVTFVGQATTANSAPTDITLANATVGENQPSGTTVGALSTTDPDAGNTFTYTLVSGTGSTGNGSFSIAGGSLLTAASFNFEAQNSYSVRIRSTDQGGLLFEKAFTITVTNANEAPTDITLANAAVGENQPSGATVGALSTTDPDAGNTFTYTLVSGTGSTGNGSFSIAGGSLLTAASFDYEAQNSYSVRIRSTDQGGLFFEKAFTITVTNVNEAPSLQPVSDATVGVGVNMSITNNATDPEPAQILTFSLLAGPGNATLHPSSGIYTWRPLVSQQDQVFPVTVQVTDNGAPPLSATNTFTLTVNPVATPMLSLLSVVDGEVSLGVNGDVGPDYILWSATNQTDWQSLLTNTPESLPFVIILTNPEPQHYYRLQLGP